MRTMRTWESAAAKIATPSTNAPATTAIRMANLMRLAIGFSLAENRIMSSGASVDGRGPQRGCAARPASARPGMGTAEPHAGAALAGATPRPGLVRPAWLPNHVRGLDTLRGLAILLVLLFHCQRRLGPLHLSGIAAWGWSGVNLFFVL